MTDVQVALTREAYLSVLAIGQALRQDGAPDAFAAEKVAVDRMLDALGPYVCGAETDLRRIVIDGVDPAVILAGLGDAS